MKYQPFERRLREAVRSALRGVANRPKLRLLEHDLTPDQAVEMFVRQGGRCAVTGIDLTVWAKNPLLMPSVDRIDSDKGYTLNNVRYVCRGYNILKLNYDDSTTIEALTAMSSGVTKRHDR